MTEFLRKVRAWRQREALDQELKEEIQTHLEMRAEDDGSVDGARQRFGNAALVLEDARSAWGWPVLETLWQDLRYSARMLLKNPGFTIVAALSLAIGIGGNAAIFTLVDKALIRKLPVEEPDRLAIVGTSTSTGVRTFFSYPDFADYRARADVFEGLLCYTQRALTLSEAGMSERIQGLIVSGNYFDVLGVHPALGRGFLPDEDKKRGSHPVVVLGHGLWRRRFGADPRLIGRTVTLNGYGFTAVGIAPPEFTGTVRGIAPDVYVPVMMQGQVSPGWKLDPLFGPRSRSLAWLDVMGRLKQGVSHGQAAAALTVLGSQVARANRGAGGAPASEPRFVVFDGSQGQTSFLKDLRFPLQMLMATVGLILLITCANIANLLLARASARHKEIAIRLAAGAGRGRLVRQLLTESLLLAGFGGALGLGLAIFLRGLLVRFTPSALSGLGLDDGLDLRVLAFTAGVSLVAGMLFGLAPALLAAGADLVPALKDDTTLFGKRARRLTLRNLLVVGQVALSMVVLVGASLCVRSLQNLQSIDAGFDGSKVLIMSADLSLSGYSNERGLTFYGRLTERVKAVPGVEAVSLAALVPLGGGFGMNFVPKIEGYVPQSGEDMSFDYNIIGADYFRTMKVPVVQGREFGPSDTELSAKVAIINETAARRFWSSQNPIGSRLDDSRAFFDTAPKKIVGVVKDSKYRRLTDDVRPTIYVPVAQDYRSNMALHVRTAGQPVTMLATLRREVQALDANLPLYDVKTLEEQKSGSLYASRMAATLLTVFGLIALLLVAIGLYGVVSHAVNRRTREIGIRIALGAQRGQVRHLVMLDGLAMVLSGLTLGLGIAFVSTRLLKTFLFGVARADPLSFGTAGVLLIGVAALASYLPARRASRTDPMTALRA